MSSSQHPSFVSVPLDPAAVEFSLVEASQLAAMVQKFHEQLEQKGKDDVSTKMLASQILLAFVGAFAGFLYKDPSATCAAGACDDAWFAQAVPDDVVRQYIYFLSGFAGFATTNCTFSYYAPKEYFDMIGKLNSRLAKVLATGGVIGFTLLQGLQISMAAEGTGASAMNMVMTVTGSLPGAVNGGVALVKGMPHLVAGAAEKLKSVYYNCRVSSLSETEQHAMAVSAFYARQRQQFNALIQANWQAVFRKLDTLEIAENEDPLAFLLSQGEEPVPESGLRWGARKFLQLALGGALTSAFTAPMLNNTYQVLNARTAMPVVSGLGATVMCSTSLYGNAFLTNKAVRIATEAAFDKLSGEPIQSLVYQLRPWQTRGLFAAGTLFAIMSYSVIDMMFNKLWAPPAEGSHWDGSAQAVARGFARTGIDLYHVMGTVDVGTQILFRRILFHGSPREKFLARLQLMVNYLTLEMPQQEFIQAMTQDASPALRAKLNVQLWDDFMAELRSDGGVSEASRERVEALGIARHWGAIARSLVKEYEGTQMVQSPASSSAGHWQSQHYLLSPKSRGGSYEVQEISVAATLDQLSLRLLAF